MVRERKERKEREKDDFSTSRLAGSVRRVFVKAADRRGERDREGSDPYACVR